jgi:hypothetical protein
VSHAWWSKYETQHAPLNHDRRNELRRAVGLPDLPWTVAQSLSNVSPNAAVWAFGEQPAERVVLVGGDQPQMLTMRLNGNLAVLEDAPPESHVTVVPRPRKPATRRQVQVSLETWGRLNLIRKSSGLSWEEFGRLWAERIEHADE